MYTDFAVVFLAVTILQALSSNKLALPSRDLKLTKKIHHNGSNRLCAPPHSLCQRQTLYIPLSLQRPSHAIHEPLPISVG